MSAVSDREGSGRWARFFGPVTVTAVLLIGLLFLGRSAMPGGTFYPVRQVLRSVGLAPASVDEVQELLDWADRLLDEAEEAASVDAEAAERHAFEAVRVIGMAEGALEELEVDERPQLTDQLARLLARAKAILTEAPDEDSDRKVDAKAVIREDDDDDTPDDDDDEGDGDPSSRDRSGHRSGDAENRSGDVPDGIKGRRAAANPVDDPGDDDAPTAGGDDGDNEGDGGEKDGDEDEADKDADDAEKDADRDAEDRNDDGGELEDESDALGRLPHPKKTVTRGTDRPRD